MKLKILLMLIVASAICIVRSEPSKRSNGGGNPLGIIKAELIEEDASAVSGPDMEMAGTDQAESESTQRIVIKPIRKHRGKRIRIRLVNAKKPKNYVRLKVAGTKNVEQKYPGEDGEENPDYDNGLDGSSNGNFDEEGNETTSQYGDSGSGNEDETTAATDDTQNGEDATKVKHHHHHHHHNHIKTVVKKVPEPYAVEKVVHVPVEKIVHVPKPYPVEKIVEKIIHVPKPYPVEKIVHVPKIVEKIVYSPLFGKDDKLPSSTTTYSGSNSHHHHFTDLTNDSKLKFGASGSSLDIIYPNGHTSSFNNKFNGPINSYGKPLGRHPKFPEFEDINKHSNKFHSILDNDAFDFGDSHTSKPKDHHNNNKNKSKKNKRRNNKNPKKSNSNNNNNNNSYKSPFDDDYFSSSSSSSSFSEPNSHSYSGISMPSYTHEFSVSNSDQKEVIFNPQIQLSSSSSPSSTHSHHHSVHYESLPFKYPSASVHQNDHEYDGLASTNNADFSSFNWSPSTSLSDYGSGSSSGSVFNPSSNSGSVFNPSSSTSFGSQLLSGAESAQSPIGPVFRPPRKNPAGPFHSKKGSHGAPRAGPRRPPRNNQGESYLRAPSPPQKMAGHPLHNHQHREGLRAQASNNKGYVHQSRPRPVMAASAAQQIETVMLPPVSETTQENEQ